MRLKWMWLIASAGGGCAPEYGLEDVPDESGSAGTGAAAADALADERLDKKCGTLATSDAQKITSPEAAEGLLYEVYGRPEWCEDGDASGDCIWRHDGTLSGAADFDVNQTDEYPKVFEYEYVYAGGSASASFLVTKFGFGATVELTSTIKVVGTHKASLEGVYDSQVEAAAAAYLADRGVDGFEYAFADHVALDEWVAQEFEYVSVEAAAEDPTNVVKISGEYFRESGSLHTVEWVYLCLEPM